MPTHGIPRPVCLERMRLTDALKAATSNLFAATTVATAKTGVDLIAVRAVSKDARHACAEARRALADHRAKHGC